MILNKEKYSIQRVVIKNWLDNKPDCDITKEISHIALATHCPIILVVEFIMEIRGELSELLVLKKKLMEFYGVTDVV